MATPAAATSRVGLLAWGWDGRHEAAFSQHSATSGTGTAVSDWRPEPGRVVVEERGSYLARTDGGEVQATASGRLRFHAEIDGPTAFPAVGDWVVLGPTGDPGQRIIHGVLPRRTSLVRRAPSDHAAPEQLLAANVDTLFIVTSLNNELNPRRLERYLALAWGSATQPVVVLSKADLAEDADAVLARVRTVAGPAPVYVVSATTGTGLDALASWLAEGMTVALVGSSGVGKSTLVNALAGTMVESTGETRADDDRGRHTTSRRHLALLPGLGLVLDTPGMRELGLVDDGDGAGVGSAFTDIDELAADCRFGDCRHEGEPGCAVHAAIADGRLDRARLDGRRKLDREVAHRERESDPRARAEERRKWRLIHASVNRKMRLKYGEDGR